jgi:Leucine-rich repeat (LRR) protein
MRDELKSVLDIALPQTPGQFAGHLIKQRWGQDIEPTTALLVTLDYDYKGRPAQRGIHQGQVASSMPLIQALLSNDQVVGDGHFGETVFGLYTPPDVGPAVHVLAHADDLTEPGNDYHYSYEGIYRRTIPQTYGPDTQIPLRPADFKKWVWELDLQARYRAYLNQAWPADELITANSPHPLKTAAKAAFVMAFFLQKHENTLSQQGFELALQAAGLPPDQTWSALTIDQLQVPGRVPERLKVGRLKLYRYTSTDIWGWRSPHGVIVLYIPGNSSPVHAFDNSGKLHQWIVNQGKTEGTKHALAAHFAEDDRKDGTFHAGVLTALDGMVDYPKQHRLNKEAGFFNDDGYWEPATYIGFDDTSSGTDPFAQLVLAMKQASRASVKTIRDDAQVNRDNLNAFVEPVVQWIVRFGPLALFVPGGEGVLALAGMIDAGYGLNQAVTGETSSERSAGVARTVFGLLNALPLAAAGAVLEGDADEVGAFAGNVRKAADSREEAASRLPGQTIIQGPIPPSAALSTRVELLRGIGAPVAMFSDEVLMQIGKISAIDDDMLRLMHSGQPPTPLLTDTINRFRIDQDVAQMPLTARERTQLFNSRYDALQVPAHEWGRLFQRQYPGVPKVAIEQMLERQGVDLRNSPDATQIRKVFKQLDSKARQYQQHVRLNRAYEGLYLRSTVAPESDTLALHSLRMLPGWPKNLRIEVREHSVIGRLLDRNGALDASNVRRLIKSGDRFQVRTGPADFYQALLDALSGDERSALQLSAHDPAHALRLKIREQALTRSQFMSGLQRMDSGLPFEAQGLRGGGFPHTPQASALTHETMRLQLREIYPDFTDTEADAWLESSPASAQAQIEHLRAQFQQLNTDLSSWVDQVMEDVEDMDIPLLFDGDEDAQGMSDEQIAEHNAELVQNTMAYERETRTELAEELTAIWQKRRSQVNRIYRGGQFAGFKLDLGYEDYHRLPVLNVRFNEVVELLMPNFHVTERESLSGFLESFPNLETLDLEHAELTRFEADGDGQGVLPASISSLTRLKSLNLRYTGLVFSEETAGKFSDLTRLQALDLSDNPLGVPPVLLGLHDLRRVNLRNTGIRQCPIGVPDEPRFSLLDLRDNHIARVPQAVLNQAIAEDRVLLLGNPLTDEDTLQQLVSLREQTGINLWLSEPGPDYGKPIVWLRGCGAEVQVLRHAMWERLAGKPSGTRFLNVIDRLSLTADFQIGYPSLQMRVWRLLQEVDNSESVWTRMIQSRGRFEDPMMAFKALEDRAGL